MTITLADVASDRVVNHCVTLDTNSVPYMINNGDRVTTLLDPFRNDATGILINKYAPFLASRRSLAEQAVDPIIKLIIDQFALDELDQNACAQMDMTFEALHTLDAEKVADMLTVFMIRGSQMDGANDMFKVCEAL